MAAVPLRERERERQQVEARHHAGGANHTSANAAAPMATCAGRLVSIQNRELLVFTRAQDTAADRGVVPSH
jgi:hypothetical protein